MEPEYTIIHYILFAGFFACGWVAGELKGQMYQAAGVYKRKEQKRRDKQIEKLSKEIAERRKKLIELQKEQLNGQN